MDLAVPLSFLAGVVLAVVAAPVRHRVRLSLDRRTVKRLARALKEMKA